jgi:hypothetical protein
MGIVPRLNTVEKLTQIVSGLTESLVDAHLAISVEFHLF